MVVRLDGTNAEEGRQILAEAALNLTTEATMLDGAGGQWSWRRPDGDTRRHRDASGRTGAHGLGGALSRSAKPLARDECGGGCHAGQGGQDVEGIRVRLRVTGRGGDGRQHGLVFVPAPFAADAMYEAIDAGIATVVCITEGVPAHEMLQLHAFVQGRGTRIVGPNCPGALSPAKANVGIIPAEIFREGSVGLVSRSGTLTYQIGHELAQLGLGCSTIVGIGGDPVVGSSFVDILRCSRPTRRLRRS